VEFECLKGKVLTSIIGRVGDDRMILCCEDGDRYMLAHEQDCCESVTIDEIVGDLDDLIGHPILIADELESNKNPVGVEKKNQESFTWTFYRLSTIQGTVVIRWYGESNGYYSESVDFEKL
jgi:hypothetical protein